MKIAQKIAKKPNDFQCIPFLAIGSSLQLKRPASMLLSDRRRFVIFGFLRAKKFQNFNEN